METKTEVINLKDGYYIKRWNRFDGDKLLWTKEKHYDNWGRVVYGREYIDEQRTNRGNVRKIYLYFKNYVYNVCCNNSSIL